MKRLASGEISIPLRVAIWYFFFGCLWILLSDRLLLVLTDDPAELAELQTWKGGLFVLVTGIGLFLLVHHYVRRLRGREQQEKEDLQTQFDQISTIFDSLNALVYVIELESHRLLYMNRRGEEFFGREWGQKQCFEVMKESHDPCLLCSSRELRSDGAEPQPPWEFQNRRTQRWYECIDRTIRWPDGRLVRLEIAIDITERKELERLKDEILSAVSHEMRTPLTAILGYAEYMLENELPGDERRNFLQILSREAERLNELIGDFLQLQRLQARRLTYRFQAIPVKQLLEEAVRPFTTFDDRRHPFAIEVAPGLPAIRGEQRGLLDALEQLISNAVKFSPPGGQITLGASVREGEVTLTVHDAGTGMKPEELQRIFQPFYRIDNSDRRPVGGTGLGLTLVREIIREHGGRVWAESTPGEGSTFFLSLPSAEG